MKPQHSKGHPGARIFAVAFVVFALFLLLQIGEQTKFSAKGQLFAQPRFWPGVGVVGMVVFGVLHILVSWRGKSGNWAGELLTWLGAAEFLIWFMAYVSLVPIIGYLPATILFLVCLCIRQGYRSPRQLMIAVIVAIVIVVTFKSALAVKIPGGLIYDDLPAGLRNFMIVYL